MNSQLRNPVAQPALRSTTRMLLTCVKRGYNLVLLADLLMARTFASATQAAYQPSAHSVEGSRHALRCWNAAFISR